MSDIGAVMWKERKCMFRGKGTRVKILLTFMSPVLLALYLPWSIGTDWFTEYPSLLIVLVVPVILMGLLIPDSFAGERERHTLATLMASRLSERSIMTGKFLLAVSVAWSMSLVSLVVGAIVVNIGHWDAGIHFYRLPVIGTAMVSGLLVTVLIGTLGIHISLRTQTVQEASQFLMGIVMTPFMILGFVVLALMKSNESIKEVVMDAIHAMSSPMGLLAVSAFFVLISAWLWRSALRKFSMSRLILD